jgi:cytochrome c-type biogenesis protein
VLPLVPAYVSYVVGQPAVSPQSGIDSARRARAVSLSAFFVLGFSTIFIALGASASTLGRWLLQYRYEANLAGGAIVALFRLITMGLAGPLKWFERELRFHPHVAGGHPISEGVTLLSFYAAGLGVPFLLAALFMRGLVARLKALGRTGRALQVAAGAIMIAMGLAMMTGQLSTFSFWLLKTVPALGRIG